MAINSGQEVTPKRLLELIGSQRHCCSLTGESLTPQIATVDHIHPVSRGGQHLMENLQWVHKDVNRMKGSMTTDEFVAMCRKVVERHDTMAVRAVPTKDNFSA